MTYPTTYGTVYPGAAGGGNPALDAGTSVTASNTGSPALVTVPSGAATGHLVLIYCAAPAASNSWTAPGFTPVNPASGANGSGQLLSRRIDGSEGWVSGTSQVKVTSLQAVPFTAAICSVANADAVAPFDPAPAVSGQVNAAATAVVLPGVTTTADGDLEIVFVFADGGIAAGSAPPVITVPAGFTAAGSQVNTTG